MFYTFKKSHFRHFSVLSNHSRPALAESGAEVTTPSDPANNLIQDLQECETFTITNYVTTINRSTEMLSKYQIYM